MGKKKETIFSHIGKAFIWSGAGLRAAWKHELAFRLQSVVIAILLPIGMWLGRTAVERVLLIISCGLVLITELLNSALEAVVDRIGPEQHPLSGRAKDLGSGAAFFSMTTAAIVWALIIYERFFS